MVRDDIYLECGISCLWCTNRRWEFAGLHVAREEFGLIKKSCRSEVVKFMVLSKMELEVHGKHMSISFICTFRRTNSPNPPTFPHLLNPYFLQQTQKPG